MILDFFRERRRARLLATTASPRWKRCFEQNIPQSSLLSPSELAELVRTARVLEAEKRFEGAGGLTVTEEMRMTVAGWGALLLFGRRTRYYPLLHTIVIYPSSFVVPVRQG